MTRFEENKPIIENGCTSGIQQNSEEETQLLKSNIQKIASESNIDARFILAVVLQESQGCVRVQTTNNGVTNPGLMQSHDGTGTCANQKGECSDSQIYQQIKDGTEGTSAGDGLQQCLNQYKVSSEATSYYRAARCYNSGSVDPSGNLGKGVATHCYVSDIANRLIGWYAGVSKCNSAIIGDMTNAQFIGSSQQTSSPTSTTVFKSLTGSPSSIPHGETSTSTSLSWSQQAFFTEAAYPSACPRCTQYATVRSGDTCDAVLRPYGITLGQLIALNPGLNSACTNLWSGYQYCVAD